MNPEFEEEKQKTLKAIRKKLSAFTKAITNAQTQYQRSKDFEHVRHLAELVKANFPNIKRGMSEIVVPDWEKEDQQVRIPLDPKSSPQEILEDMFTKSQKLKKALTPLQALLKKLDNQYRALQEAEQKVLEIQEYETLKTLQSELDLFKEKPTLVTQKTAHPYHLFYSASKHEIFVGKNAASNDHVTFSIAHGNDLWLHAHQMSGSHVVVRKKKGHEVDPETLTDAMQLALYFSKARQSSGSFDVLVTEKKYVQRLPRTPKGKVVVQKHKTMTITLDKERIETIKSRR